MNKFKKSFAIISAAMMIASVSACSASTTSGSGSDNAAVQEKQKVSLDEQILDIEGIGNARQLGGYVTSDGRKVKNTARWTIISETGLVFPMKKENSLKICIWNKSSINNIKREVII